MSDHTVGVEACRGVWSSLGKAHRGGKLMPVFGDLMVSGSEVKDFSEHNRVAMETEETTRRATRKLFSVISLVISGVIMVSGVKMIGQSEHVEGSYFSGGYFTYWHTAQLEWGILFTLVGTLAVAFSVMFLVSAWKRKGV